MNYYSTGSDATSCAFSFRAQLSEHESWRKKLSNYTNYLQTKTSLALLNSFFPMSSQRITYLSSLAQEADWWKLCVAITMLIFASRHPDRNQLIFVPQWFIWTKILDTRHNIESCKCASSFKPVWIHVCVCVHIVLQCGQTHTLAIFFFGALSE